MTTKFLEIHKVKKRLNLIFFKNGNLIASQVIDECGYESIDETIGAIKQWCESHKVKYQVYR